MTTCVLQLRDSSPSTLRTEHFQEPNAPPCFCARFVSATCSLVRPAVLSGSSPLFAWEQLVVQDDRRDMYCVQLTIYHRGQCCHNERKYSFTLGRMHPLIGMAMWIVGVVPMWEETPYRGLGRRHFCFGRFLSSARVLVEMIHTLDILVYGSKPPRTSGLAFSTSFE